MVRRVAARARRTTVERLSVDEARRIAVEAQGFGQPGPAGRVDRRHLRRMIDRIDPAAEALPILKPS